MVPAIRCLRPLARNDSIFRSLNDPVEQVVVTLDGREVSVPAAVSVAAALLYLDRLPTRHSTVGGAGRAPFCMMGVCFECLLEIDGVPDQRACQVQVAPGMQLQRRLRPKSESE